MVLLSVISMLNERNIRIVSMASILRLNRKWRACHSDAWFSSSESNLAIRTFVICKNEIILLPFI